jgi:hypothetical protein
MLHGVTEIISDRTAELASTQFTFVPESLLDALNDISPHPQQQQKTKKGRKA